MIEPAVQAQVSQILAASSENVDEFVVNLRRMIDEDGEVKAFAQLGKALIESGVQATLAVALGALMRLARTEIPDEWTKTGDEQ